MLSAGTHPFTLTIQAFAANCQVEPRSRPAPASYRGIAERFELVALPYHSESERNRAGLVFFIDGPNEVQGTYLLVEHAPVDQTLAVGERHFRLVLRKEQRPLPFAIELLDFERVVYPGTEIPKSFL